MTLVEKKEERHGKDIIVLTIYALEDGSFTFSLQCAVAGIIRASYPHQLPDKYASPASAKTAALTLLKTWTAQSRTAKARLKEFGITFCDTQLEFNFDIQEETS